MSTTAPALLAPAIQTPGRPAEGAAAHSGTSARAASLHLAPVAAGARAGEGVTVPDPALPEAPAVRELVAAAAAGDARAWDEIVERFAGLVWHVARSHRLDAAAAADVSQTVWLRLVENLGRLRDPEALAGWIATTSRNESLRSLRRSGREVPDDDAVERLADLPGTASGPEAVALADERRTTLWRAVTALPPRCQALLRALSSVQEPSYAQVSAALGMPIGSIGPTRSRCFDALRRQLAALGLTTAGE